jgi:hypothetical protein
MQSETEKTPKIEGETPQNPEQPKRGHEPKFSQFEIAEYVCGWLLHQEDFKLYSIENIEGALANAKGQLRDGQDGILASQSKSRHLIN